MSVVNINQELSRVRPREAAWKEYTNIGLAESLVVFRNKASGFKANAITRWDPVSNLS